MQNGLHGDGLLDTIRSLSAQGASGRLQISTGTTNGALFFDRGQLVDARLANLSGFQAINAVASVPDASYSFDPTIPPPVRGSITANERILLRDFFGIIPDENDEITLVRPQSDIVEPHTPLPDQSIPLPDQPISQSSFRPVFFFVLLTALLAIAAAAVVYRLRTRSSSTPVASTSTVQSPTPVPANVPPAPISNEITSAVPPAPTGDKITSAVPNLTGNWSVVNTVEQTSYQPYKNMKVGFNVSINQNGKDFTGKGEKISENGQSLPADSRTPILVKGRVDGDKVEATFTESGALRKTNGRFVWRVDKASGGLTGTFSSTAARTRGKSAAKKGS